MDDKRDNIRHRVLKGATIEFNRAGGITCAVRNLSETGACLNVVSPLGVPESFDLVFEADQSRKACQVVWRTEKQIGVSFKK